MPLVSVILPTYNGNKSRLSEAINSILSQTFSDFELIIINDASTNNIETTILRYAEQEPRIVYVKNDINLKLTATLNKALWLAKWEFIARIDDDDIRIDTEKLQKQVNFLKEYQEYGMCGAKHIISIDEEGKELQFVHQYAPLRFQGRYQNHEGGLRSDLYGCYRRDV